MRVTALGRKRRVGIRPKAEVRQTSRTAESPSDAAHDKATLIPRRLMFLGVAAGRSGQVSPCTPAGLPTLDARLARVYHDIVLCILGAHTFGSGTLVWTSSGKGGAPGSATRPMEAVAATGPAARRV